MHFSAAAEGFQVAYVAVIHYKIEDTITVSRLEHFVDIVVLELLHYFGVAQEVFLQILACCGSGQHQFQSGLRFGGAVNNVIGRSKDTGTQNPHHVPVAEIHGFISREAKPGCIGYPPGYGGPVKAAFIQELL